MITSGKMSRDVRGLLEKFFTEQRIVVEGTTKPVFQYVKDNQDKSGLLIRELNTLDRSEVGTKPLVAIDVGRMQKIRMGVGDIQALNFIGGSTQKRWMEQRPLGLHCITKGSDRQADFLARVVAQAVDNMWPMLAEDGYHDFSFVTISDPNIIHHRGTELIVYDVVVLYQVQYEAGITLTTKEPIMAGFEGPIFENETGGS